MLPRCKNLLVAVCLVVLVAVRALFVTYQTYVAARDSKAADEVYFAMVELPAALERYQLRLGAPAPNLNVLIPDYLPQIPQSPAIESVEYRVTHDGRHWELTMSGSAFSASRSYDVRDSSASPKQGGAGFRGNFRGWAAYAR